MLARVLELQGLIENWSALDVPAGQDVHGALLARAARADVNVVFDGFSVLEWMSFPHDPAYERPAWLGVLVSSRAEAAWFKGLGVQVLPADGEPLLGRRDRERGLLDVIRGLQEIIKLRGMSFRSAWRRSDLITPESQSKGPATEPGVPSLSIGDIFKLNGPPSITFVEPSRFRDLKFELETLGTGLIVEGPSRVGKSTAVRKAMEVLAVPAERQIWWNGRTPPTLEAVQQQLAELQRARQSTWLFIDDFHHLADDAKLCRSLAFGMKGLADQAQSHAKITLIGINPLGSSLVQAMPDLVGRFRIERLDIEQDWQRSTKIVELIFLGERAANLRFRRRDELVIAAAGSFFLAQFLCHKAARAVGMSKRAESTVEIDLGPEEVIASIQKELAASYRPPLLGLASFDREPLPRGAGLSLLWLLARSPEGFISVREARLRFPMLAAAFDWFLESNLTRCFRAHPALQGLLYYNRSAGTLTMEDPQLKFYLRQLDWEEFALASGHGDIQVHPDDGPLWPHQPPGAGLEEAASFMGAFASVRTLEVLHLSDLHFSSKDQATASHARLSADLRGELGVERLDALVVSGDIVNRAEAREYDAARFFLEQVMKGFSVSSSQLVLVPGNHDVSWERSKVAYSPVRKADYRGAPRPGKDVDSGKFWEIRDDKKYRLRLQSFSAFYKELKGSEYPLEYAEQALFDEPVPGLLVLGLNSAWEIDHEFRDRAGIHAEALGNALAKLGPAIPEQLRMAVFHHPIHGGEESRIKDAAFLQQLAANGFRLALHGHVHKADAELYRHDRSEGGRQLELVAAGTFGAPTREWVPGYPLQYNLLRIGAEQVAVETRRREEVNGAWSPDARWRQGAGKDPLPRYFIKR